MSCQTSTWPSVPAPAPIPIVGTESRPVTSSATGAGTASSTIAKQPAASSSLASWTSCRASSLRRPCALKPPRTVEVCGVSPTWPMTPIPASTIARARCTDVPPRSSLTTSAPPSLTRRIALCTACSSETSYESKGMSPTTIGRRAPRETHWVMKTISSMVTGTVDARPCTTMPELSPTRIRSMPAASARRALGAS